MTNGTCTAGTTSITRTIATGLSRSRRVVAALALTAGLSLGVAGFAVPQADASCRLVHAVLLRQQFDLAV